MNRLLLMVALLLAGCAPDITETDFFSRHPEPSETSQGDLLLAEHNEGAVSIRVLSTDGLKWGLNSLTVEAEGISSLTTTAYLDPGSSRIESPLGGSSAGPEEPVHILDPGVDGDWMIDRGAYYTAVISAEPTGGQRMTWEVPVVGQAEKVM